MAEHMVPVKLLDDVTECPICMESCNDPRSLPCIHTFCLACIRKWSGDKHRGDIVNCPCCRKKFKIPEKGFEELPKNFFIEKLLAMKDISSSASGSLLCDWCVADTKIPTEKKNKAKQFCVECQESLCEDCIDTHSKLKLCRTHTIHNIGEEVPDASAAILPTKCDKHPKEDLKLFCTVCNEALCILCFATKHTGHKSAEIEEVADEFRKEIRGHISHLWEGQTFLAESLASFEIKRQKLVHHSEKVADEICNRAEQLKSIVERHKQQLIAEMTQLKTEKLKEVDAMVNDMKQNKIWIEGLIKYSEELLKKGSSGDIAREIKLLNLRVADIKQSYDLDGAATTSDSLVKFVPSDTTQVTSGNAVGRLEMIAGDAPTSTGQQQFKPVASKRAAMQDTVTCPTLRFILPGNGYNIDAVTSFNKQLFVTRNETTEVEIYNSSTFELLRTIRLPEDVSRRREGLAVCSANYCLYVSDWDNRAVHKIDLSASDKATKWSVAKGPQGLSVNKSHNLLVACYNACTVQEYTTSGKLVREIKNVVDVRHAVELNDGTLVVSHGSGKGNYVSVVSLKGTSLRRYPRAAAALSEPEKMRDPRRLAVDKNGYVLVADRVNSRILVLNPELTDARTLPLTLDTPLTTPLGLCFKESRGRLYVGEDCGKKRILVFDNVYNLHTLFKS